MKTFTDLLIYSDYLYSKKEYAYWLLVKFVFERTVFPEMGMTKLQYFKGSLKRGFGDGKSFGANHYRCLLTNQPYGNGFNYGERIGYGHGKQQYFDDAYGRSNGNGGKSEFGHRFLGSGSGYGY